MQYATLKKPFKKPLPNLNQFTHNSNHMKEPILTKKFNASISIDDGYKNHYQGEFEQTMEVYDHGNGILNISWEIPDMNGGVGESVGIGIWSENKVVTDYDGVFELPQQAIDMLKELGYDTTEVE